MKFTPLVSTILLSAQLLCPTAEGAGNSIEANVLPYTLPDVLPSSVTSKEGWAKRRLEIMELLTREVYGKSPEIPQSVKFETTLPAGPSINGKAVRKQISVFFKGDSGPALDILIYLPANAKGPVPIFWGLNFTGNHSVETDPAIPLCRSWMPNDKKGVVVNNKATDAGRGEGASRWQIETAIDAGYGVATACYHDADPDFDDGFKNGVHGCFPEIEAKRDGATWGSIAACSWSMCVGMSYFTQDKAIDAKRVVAMGHSRLGKAAIWAGALDERFAILISNDSGAGGAALSKRNFGETVADLNTRFPHWFAGNFSKYNGKEAEMSFDQHFALATIAPRPLLVCSATEDLWADPKGEFLSAQATTPVYKLFGKEGMTASEQPGPDKLIDSIVGYNLRTGKHDVTLEDWKAYIAFANKHLPKP